MEEKLERLEKNRLATECAKLDLSFERLLAEEGLSEDLPLWPEYRGAKFAGPAEPLSCDNSSGRSG